jgi:peptide/nickel transport system ATP-binding protein
MTGRTDAKNPSGPTGVSHPTGHAATEPVSAPDRVPALEVDDLVMHFGPVRAVDGVSLRIDEGKVLALVGESGSGKSTVGKCIIRLITPTSGRIRVAGVDITRMNRRELRTARANASIVFQDPAGSIDPRMLVGDVIAEPLRLSTTRYGRKQMQSMVAEQLGLVGLREQVAQRYPHELSGGQRQRVSLARALISQPRLLIADEPTSALDVSVQASVLNLFADLQREIGFACLFITHDLAAVDYLADDLAVMYLGQLAESGTRAQVVDEPAHPYTQSLLAAAPIADPVTQRSRTKVILGDDLPSAMNPPDGCRFHTRCPLAFDRCRVEVPAARHIDGRVVTCHLVATDGSGPDVRRPETLVDLSTPALREAAAPSTATVNATAATDHESQP